MTGPVAVVRACTRAGEGGSPTAVLAEGPFTDAERRALPGRYGASHAVFVDTRETGTLGLRFFTAAGELPACGHGTIAALAWAADRTGPGAFRLAAGGRRFDGTVEASTAEAGAAGGSAEAHATGYRAAFDVAFDAGPVAMRDPGPDETGPVLAALGADRAARVAGTGRERLLVPVADVAALAGLGPDFGALRAACDAAGYLGCFVYAPAAGRFAARMFAPSIGVDEDVANANSVACLAAHLGVAVEVVMGAALGRPAVVGAEPRAGGVWLSGGAVVCVSVRR
ncbi:MULTISPECIES: PhzF family phenazine biosynthesis protein [Glycomyces]|uniref:PhzF family phenazine biosynthesis protein n=2 Tax=Glycomyces TaxID=58113 RepID=A0A9X3PN90_9ACTN|nr:PhzF family phenazine biosynthesis protein [Glycomyces lechevalierae]MDA1386936.1 PhzF family phenazine biosynthesis protein [Glycomyces lechevalierae]MDR7341591.1 putative PhzF superfamily epimerase YddE/YHI9 [Glycomyces lechevalierae]